MSDPYYEDDANAVWNEAYEADPAGTTWALAQHAAAQNQPDPAYLASLAAAQVNEINSYAAANAEAERLAQTLDRSMSAEYGQEWTALAPKVGAKLAVDEDFGKLIDSDPNAALQHLDGIFQEVRSTSGKRGQDNAEWNRIRSAGQNEYWRSSVFKDMQGGQ